MSELAELYREMVVEHGQRPRNTGVLAGPNVRSVEGDNPLCGDQLTVYVQVDDEERITAVRFEGHGCAISTASSSLMTEAVQGLTVDAATALFHRFRAMMTGDDDGAELGKLEVLRGVRAYPMRVKCATLAWHTLAAALSESPPEEPVRTE